MKHDLSKLKNRVQRGELSPLEALDKIVLAKRAGVPASPALVAWVEGRIKRARRKYGTHGHLTRGI